MEDGSRLVVEVEVLSIDGGSHPHAVVRALVNGGVVLAETSVEAGGKVTVEFDAGRLA